jgi:hypothetical protein
LSIAPHTTVQDNWQDNGKRPGATALIERQGYRAIAIVGDHQIIEAKAVFAFRSRSTITTIAAWCAWSARKSVASWTCNLVQSSNFCLQQSYGAAKLTCLFVEKATNDWRDRLH